MSLSGEEEGKQVERWQGAGDAFEFDKSQTQPVYGDDDQDPACGSLRGCCIIGRSPLSGMCDDKCLL